MRVASWIPALKGRSASLGIRPTCRLTSKGSGRATIETILLDQISGFDADTVPNTNPPVTRVPPTNTFHVGFWFNNPDDAAPWRI